MNCKVDCPTYRPGYLETVLLKDDSGALLDKLAEHCRSTFSINSDTYELAPHQLATFDHFEWNGGFTFVFVLGILIWVLLRTMMTVLAFEKHVGFHRDGWLFTRVAALPVLVDTVNVRFGGALSLVKFLWLTAPTDALLTPLSTLVLHEDCSQLVLFNVPDLEEYYLVMGIMSYSLLVFALLVVSICIPFVGECAGCVFSFSCIPFFLAGCYMKLLDINIFGFSASFFLGVNPALAFQFAWPEDLLSISFAVMRLLLVVLYCWDLVEDLESAALDRYLRYKNKKQDS